jgi:hypothetical protein
MNDDDQRLLMIFASRSVADEWWRSVSKGGHGALANSVSRITPQFYNHIPDQFDIRNFFTDQKVNAISNPFRGKVFFSLLNNRGGRTMDIVPTQPVTDHVNGGW